MRRILRPIDRLAAAAQSDRKRWAERVRLFHNSVSLRLIVDDTDGRVDDAVLHRP